MCDVSQKVPQKTSRRDGRVGNMPSTHLKILGTLSPLAPAPRPKPGPQLIGCPGAFWFHGRLSRSERCLPSVARDGDGGLDNFEMGHPRIQTPRRIYQVTQAGEAHLAELIDDFRRIEEELDRFLKAYSGFVNDRSETSRKERG
jgi:hypothetical protein